VDRSPLLGVQLYELLARSGWHMPTHCVRMKLICTGPSDLVILECEIATPVDLDETGKPRTITKRYTIVEIEDEAANG